MEIYPAIDLFQGKVVRLERGDYGKSTVYGDSAGEMAVQWLDEGAEWLHVVDLEGARSGEIKEWKSLESIVDLGRGSIQFGGGVRRGEDIRRLRDLGVERIILGTKALDPSFLRQVADEFAEGIGISLDLRGEEVWIEGWQRSGSVSVYEIFKEIGNYPFDCLIITNIEKDGTLGGVDPEKMKRLLAASPLPVIFSGGISRLDDLEAVKRLEGPKLKGVIVGKALYEGRIKLREAIAVAEGRTKL